MIKCVLILTTLAFALTSFQTGHTRILNVPSDYATIQAGIDEALDGDTVLVAPGEYQEYLQLADKNILLSASDGPDTTIIQGRCWINGQIDTTCVIKGFSFISNGSNGLSLLSLGPDAAPVIEADILHGNFMATAGGAIACWGGNPIIRSNIISNNFATFIGGGICFENSSAPCTSHAEVTGNIIYNNWAAAAYGSGNGGGIYLLGDATIKYNLIYDNLASMYYSGGGGHGGGIARVGSSQAHKTTITNNTIVNNSARIHTSSGIGGGIYLNIQSPLDTLIVKNNIIAFNPLGGNVRASLNDSVYCQWDYNLIFGDTTSVFPHGDHDIFLDPIFADTASDNYHLLPGSPCIDSGDPTFPLDPDSTRADIGAYYFDQAVGIDEPGPSGPYRFALAQNYPNPFNARTVISYTLDKDAKVSLLIYSITGQRVKSLTIGESQQAGEHRYIWDGVDSRGKAVSTGIYFYELYVDDPAETTAGKYRESKAMILVR
ncbi:MAG: hypothetical protein A2W25_02265 [candidate division Zixibacteria bacterium RBG_16_53_22]|nr:MAG: hypothetical protein A2W25_02265 [candidate division Zixibacteria bacterium RBG_16_53_22]